MALSNWDTLAVDLSGPCDGSIVIPSGATLEIYKNWLYLHDPHAWRDGCGFCEPTIAEIHAGEMQYHDLRINAVRGPQDGVYVVAHRMSYVSDELSVMVGCGVYGYDGDEWIGVTAESAEFLREHARRVIAENFYNRRDDAMKAIEALDGGVRFNQGDAYFAAHIPGLGLAATRPGEAETPVMQTITETGEG